jgi:hypothetical protein
MLAFANPIFVLHRCTPLRCATRSVTIIRAETRPVRNYRPVQTCSARLDARFATESLSDHHVAMIDAAFASEPPMFEILHSQHCQPACKITAKNKISHEVKLLGCDLLWTGCVPFLPAVNSRENANILRILVQPMCPRAVAILRHLEKPWDRRCRYLRDTRAAAVRLTAIRL